MAIDLVFYLFPPPPLCVCVTSHNYYPRRESGWFSEWKLSPYLCKKKPKQKEHQCPTLTHPFSQSHTGGKSEEKQNRFFELGMKL